MTTTKKNAKRDQAVAEIAKATLGIETLEERRSDSLDFHDVSVWQIRMALQAAYDIGAAQNGGR